MDTVTKSGKMDLDMTDSGIAIKQMAKANLFMLMAMFMRASGTMTKPMVMELIDMPMELLMSASGQKINNTEEESKSGQMVLNMKECIKMVRNMAMVPSLLLTALLIPDNFLTMRFPDLVNMFGLMEKCMKEHGKEIKCMETESLYGKMAKNMKDSS